MKTTLDKTENYLETRKEYEEFLSKDGEELFEKLVNDKTKEGREKIIQEIGNPEGTEIKKIQEWIGKAGKIISVTSNRASIINDIHHR